MVEEGSSPSTFIDELIAEAEQQDMNRLEGYHDLLLLQIHKLQEAIEHNFAEAEKEIQIINQWALNKNHSLQTKIEWIERRLEVFIRERKVKTIDLPNGVLKVHKKPDKVEIVDMDAFLKVAKPELLSIIPEQVKPDLLKIKAFIKTRPVPAGVNVIEGKEEFSYKLRKELSNGGEKAQNGAAIEPAGDLRIAG